MNQAAAVAAGVVLPGEARFVPFADVGDVPHIVVDGAPRSSTSLTLSHWPVNATPAELKRDTSTETVFAYLDTPRLHVPVDSVTNNHFDEDGLCSAFALCRPGVALAHRELLIETARAGDFGTATRRNALRLFFLIESFADPASSPLKPDTFTARAPQRTALLYLQMLDRLPALLEDLDAWREYWRDDEEFLEASDKWCRSGRIGIDEQAELDLAIVDVPDDLPKRPFRRYTRVERAAVHPFAIHRRTVCNRILWLQGRNYEFTFRYESWVQMATRRPALRVDLTDLAALLNDIESAPGRWIMEPVDEVAPRLYLHGAPESGIERETFVATLLAHLAEAPVAWDPYDWKSDDQ